MKKYLFLYLLALITPVWWPYGDPNNKTTINYIRRTGRLWGAADLTLWSKFETDVIINDIKADVS